MLEETMVDLGGATPSCRASCGACCHLEIDITPEEGALLAEKVTAGHGIDRARLALQASRARKDPAWAAVLSGDNRCVFLGPDSACTVYQDRPSSCRKLLVVSHPKECGTLDGAVQAITIPLAEVLLSTVISLSGATFMSLSKAVTLALEGPTPSAT
jgi:Fe-S-cluster containining protein